MNLTELENMTHFEHSKKVSMISAMLAQCAGFSKNEICIIRKGSLFHDIGKHYISDEILCKPGKLTEQEFATVRTHTTLAHVQLDRTLQVLAAADIMATFHHEKMDGSGYHGLVGAEIPLYARLVAVADVFDALISKRVYKEAWKTTEVFDYIAQQSGTKLDKEFVKHLFELKEEILALYEGGK